MSGISLEGPWSPELVPSFALSLPKGPSEGLPGIHERADETNFARGLHSRMLGILLALSAAVGFGSAAVFTRLGMQYMRSTTATLASLTVGTAVTMALALILHWREVFDLRGIAFAWLILAGLLNFPLGRLLNFVGISLAGVSRTSPIIGASPLLAMVLAVIILGEPINLPIVLGTVSIISGLALILSQQ